MDIATIPTPPTLTAELKNQIIQLASENKTIEDISITVNIPLDTLKELFQKERQDRLIKKSEKESEELLDIDLKKPGIEKMFGKNTLALMKLKQVERMFLLETLGKDTGYSRRNELTGKNGEAIQIKEILFHAPVPNKLV